MAIYFTSDLHLHHTNIIRYAHRNPPFRNTAEMDRGLIRRWNNVVARHDTVYYLGDFCFARTRNIGDAMRIYHDAMRMVRGRTVFLRGNHDRGLQHAEYFICRRIDGINIFMRHWPPWEHPRRFPHFFNVPYDVDLILCGHVHDKWRYRVCSVGQRRVPVINVGTDVWGYEPISLGTIMMEVVKY
jgi:calcineurin-like phosphoesterase family protein